MSANQICAYCQEEFSNLASFHKHVTKHNIKVWEYYHRYFPRRDPITQELLPFVNRDQYFEQQFISRETEIEWLRRAPRAESKEYLTDWILRRKEKKNLHFTPSQVELVSLGLSTEIFQQFCGDYYQFAAGLGFTNRFPQLPDKFPFDPSLIRAGHKLLIDTREQKLLSFDIPTEIATLPFGDYCLNDPKTSDNTYIERKSIEDFVGTFGGAGRERFRREVEKAATAGAYLVVIVESSLFSCMNFKRRWKKEGTTTSVRPEFIFHTVRELMQDFQNLQFVFTYSRAAAALTTKRLLFSHGAPRRMDLQFAFDKTLL